MITIEKGLFFGNKYYVYEDGKLIGEIQKPFLLSNYSIFLGKEEWMLKPISFWKSGYKVEKDGELLLSAKTKFSFKSEWGIHYKGKDFKWLKPGFFNNEYQLSLANSEHVVGYCRPTSILRFSWEIDFPPNVDHWFQLALFSLSEISSFKSTVVS